MKPLDNRHFGPANRDVILLLYRGFPLSEVKFYFHGTYTAGTMELVLYREVNIELCPLFRGSFKRGSTVYLLKGCTQHTPSNKGLLG